MQATNVLCPLDGSPEAERALPSAMDAARTFGLQLALFSAVEDPHLVQRQTEYLEGLSDKLEGLEAGAEVDVDPHAPRAIAARAGGDSLVVMATSTQPLIHHGYLGSAAETVVRHAVSPTVLVGPRARRRLAAMERTAVCCDGSALSELALEPACEWSRALDAELWVVTVVPPSYGTGPDPHESSYVHRLAKPLDAQWDVLHGADPARAIAGWREDALIVMTSHGRAGWSRLKMGSVTTATVRWAPGPVVVARGLVDAS